MVSLPALEGLEWRLPIRHEVSLPPARTESPASLTTPTSLRNGHLATEPEITIGDRVRVHGNADGLVVRIHTFSTGETRYFVRLALIPTAQGEWMRREDLELLLP
jgi:hypothetical protein